MPLPTSPVQFLSESAFALRSFALCFPTNSPRIKSLRTLCTKYPGWGIEPAAFATPKKLATGRRTATRDLSAIKAHGSRATSHDPRITGHDPPTTNHDPRVTGHAPRITNHGSFKCYNGGLTQGATRFRRKLSRPEGMPAPTWP